LLIIGGLFDLAGYGSDMENYRFVGNLLIFFSLLMVLNSYVLTDAINFFQNKLLPAMMEKYEQLLKWTTVGWRPVKMLIGTFALLIFSFVFFVFCHFSVVCKICDIYSGNSIRT
jgi:hypothetical protein